MSVEVTVEQFGTSVGVLLPVEIIDALRVGIGDSLFLSELPDGTFCLTRMDFAQSSLSAPFAERVQAYEPLLRGLRQKPHKYVSYTRTALK